MTANSNPRRIAWDTETHLIQPGQLFPRLVCASFAEWLPDGSMSVWLRDRGAAVPEILGYLADPEVTLVGHNVPYDLAVVAAEAQDYAVQGYSVVPRSPLSRRLSPLTTDELVLPARLIWDAYEQGRVEDTMTRAMLWDIARGDFQQHDSGARVKSYALQALAERWAGRRIEKEDTWRLRYAELDGVPLDEWPADARQYALDDAAATLEVDSAIVTAAIREGCPGGRIPDQDRQARAAWILHLMAGWGVRVDGQMVEEIKRNLQAQLDAGRALLAKWGVWDPVKGKKYTKRLKELIALGYQAQGKEPPQTAKGAIKTGADDARASGHPAGIAVADIANAEKLMSTYVPALERGAQGTPITSRPNVLVASGRTSWGAPNWQNPPRVGGIRECVVPRPGRVLCAADLDTVELRALAQTCLELVGWSEMAAALRLGQDLHLALGAEILGMDYAQAKTLYDAGDSRVGDARQAAKAANFGFPGGMGARKFRLTQLESRPGMTEADARELREAWFRRWPEMREYLAYAGKITDDQYGSRMVAQPWSGRVRGGLDYCSAANTFFQGRVADGCKLALWRLGRASYVDTRSALFGSRIVLFLHDEVIPEVWEETAHEAAQELVKILCAAVQEVIPDVPITSSAVLMRHWYKGAKPVYQNGRLVPSKPLEQIVNGKKKITWIADMDIGQEMAA